MSVLTILQSPWAIRGETLTLMWDIYEAHLTRNGRLSQEDIARIEASTGKRLDGSRLPTTVMDGVAVIPVMGPMIPRATMFQEISGATSYAAIRNDVESALKDPAVTAILLNFDSPGGAVNQLFDTAEFLRNASAIKPIMAWTDGYMTSAAQLLGAATEATYIGSNATELGSIGVIAMHRDISKQEEKRGEKTTLITAGKYKGVGHPYGPLTEEDRGQMQERVDYLYGAFVDSMADYRRMDRQKVADEVADARIFTGRQAIEAGLADGIKSFDEMIAHMKDLGASHSRTTISVSGGTATAEIPKGEKRMTREDLQQQHPALYAEIFEEGKQAGIAEGRTAAVNDERERVMSILDIPGPSAKAHRDIIMDGVKNGLSAGDTALALQRKEAEVLAKAAEDIQTGATQAAPVVDAGMDAASEKVKEAACGDAMARAAEDWAKRN
jgi:signal peptide peptidase SppA